MSFDLWLQESVLSTIIKFCLKSLQEFVRLQTFNRSGFQQIHLDAEYLKNTLKEFVDDEAAIDFLLKEVSDTSHVQAMKSTLRYLKSSFVQISSIF